MKSPRILAVTCVAFSLLYGCASQQAAKEIAAEVEPVQAPTFTQEETDAMSTEEKLAIYKEVAETGKR